MDDVTTDYQAPATAGDAAAAASAPLRRHPLRFLWQMDGEGRFLLGSDEFYRLIGARTAASFGRLWSEIVATHDIDPEERVTKAVATRNTWSGITVNWPVDGGARLAVELSGLPIYDRAGNFAGYRGFGVCRDIDSLTRLAALRRHERLSDPPAPGAVDIVQAGPAADLAGESDSFSHRTTPSIADESSHQNDLEHAVDTPKNVLPFRPIAEARSPSLTTVESNAFDELARQLSERLDSPKPAAIPVEEAPKAVLPVADLQPDPDTLFELPRKSDVSEQPEWLARPEAPPRGEAARDRTLLDLIPVGVLIYRLDRLLYANRAFLERIGYDGLPALEEAGGLDALFVEPGVSSASSTSGTGTPVTISANPPHPDQTPAASTDAHLFTISWDGDPALALIFATPPAESGEAEKPKPAAVILAVESSPAVGQAKAEDLGAILDSTAEGIVMFDAQGAINSCNRSAEALFGYNGDQFVECNLTELFAPESQRMVLDILKSVKDGAKPDHDREGLGRTREGGFVPLAVTIGRTQPNGPQFFAVFRDLSQDKKAEGELMRAQRLADRAADSRTDMLARISHEVRTPLNAIIGFADVMIEERFGTLGNGRYIEYMKDIRASGERVIAIVNDLHDLSRIESGKMDLAFANQDLNNLVEQCVAAMQPQANRERIIIRTSLAHTLPPIVADPRALRQIALNLIGSSIHLANAGGQVIVSTALSDFGEVMLRVRDTGHGLNDNEVAAAMEPFGNPAPRDQASDSAGLSLSLTKALVEANRAKFHIKAGPQAGTLIEVMFPANGTSR